MAESGEYLVPLVCGKPYIDKPPLFNWAVALLFRLTGRVDFVVARIPAVASAIAGLLGVYLLGRRWFSARAGMFAAGIWGTSWLVVEWGRFSRMDIMLAALILYGIVFADLAATAQRRWVAMVIMGVAGIVTGAATLSKGPFALGFVVVAVHAWDHRLWQDHLDRLTVVHRRAMDIMGLACRRRDSRRLGASGGSVGGAQVSMFQSRMAPAMPNRRMGSQAASHGRPPKMPSGSRPMARKA